MRWVLGIIGMCVLASGGAQMALARTSDIKIYAMLILLAGVILFCTAVLLTALDTLERCINSLRQYQAAEERREPLI